MSDKPDDFLGMSDEDFHKLNGPSSAPVEEAPIESAPVVEEPAVEAAAPVVQEPVIEEPKNEPVADVVEPNPGDTPAVADGQPGSGDQSASEPEAKDPAAQAPADAKPGDKPEAVKPAEPKAETQSVSAEEFLKQVMTPFKANGRTIALKTPEEAIRLMQMGAGYGRKIQDLQPHLKVLRMLEKNDLLDEGKLSLLIDVSQKNPDAIKKIVKDSGIDPLDLNIDDTAVYTPRNHSVSDKEMEFQSALEDVQSNPTGTETLTMINQTWDQQSKSALWDNPELLRVMQTQRDLGIYDQISEEIDRQKTVGLIPASTPFLQAYKQVGDHLQATNGFKIQANQPQSEVTPQPQVIATRTAAPKAQVTNGDKAAAAASPKTIPAKQANVIVNPLEMADDEFLKNFRGRL